MKTNILLFAAAAALFCSCAGVQNRITGNGNEITRTMAVAPFDRVEASRGVHVTLTPDTTALATIKADDNIIDYVIVKVEEGELSVSISPSIHVLSHPNVEVFIPTNGRIKALTAKSAASITSSVRLSHTELELDASSAAKIDIRATVERCKADASSASNITAEIEGDSIQPAQALEIQASSASTIDIRASVAQCTVEASSASVIKLAGRADLLTAEISSAGKLRAFDLTAANANIEVSSGSKAKVNCTSVLRASASSGASISYMGDCLPEIHASSGGSVSKY